MVGTSSESVRSSLFVLALGGLALGAVSGCALPEDEADRSGTPEEAFEQDVRPPDEAGTRPETQQLISESIVVPILLVPAGSSVTSTQLLQLRQALGNVRMWYQRELPNKDLKWDTLKVLNGQQTAAYYLQNNNVWNEIPNEIRTAFGWNPWDNTASNHVALVIGRGLLGWAGGAGYDTGRGLAILGLESLVDPAACAGNWWCTQEVWHGTAIHELGHALTLPHDTDPTSIMNFHGDYKNKHLTSVARTQVEWSPATIANRPYPRARWTFDNRCAGGVVPDESGYGNTLSMSGGIACPTGLIEGAGNFDGIDDRGQVGHGGLGATSALTLTAWVRPDNVTKQQTIVSKWYTPDSYELGLVNGRYTFTVTFPGGTWGVPYQVSAAATAGTWAHIAGVFTGSFLYMYVNGQLIHAAYAPGTLQSSTRPVTVGNHPSWNAFDGLIDDVQIYNAALERNDIFSY